ncbi:MAG TPA: hypothetical protein VH988_03115 [Thermoanaerobaculia bacterium]|jgi:hypothetical protein|nr:hypothetical protein [Thermoanaerobaculia bacterium]
MRKNEMKKLTLSKETLFPMNGTDLLKAVGGGGGWSDNSVCPTVPPTTGN